MLEQVLQTILAIKSRWKEWRNHLQVGNIMLLMKRGAGRKRGKRERERRNKLIENSSSHLDHQNLFYRPSAPLCALSPRGRGLLGCTDRQLELFHPRLWLCDPELGTFGISVISTIIKNDLFAFFKNKINNLFLHQSCVKSLLPVKLT